MSLYVPLPRAVHPVPRNDTSGVTLCASVDTPNTLPPPNAVNRPSRSDRLTSVPYEFVSATLANVARVIPAVSTVRMKRTACGVRR